MNKDELNESKLEVIVDHIRLKTPDARQVHDALFGLADSDIHEDVMERTVSG